MAEERVKPHLIGRRIGHQNEEGDIHKRAFEFYYANGRSATQTARSIGIGHVTVRHWRDRFNWESRCDERAELEKKAVEVTSLERIEAMLKRHDRHAARLIEMGMEYLEKEGFDSASDALKAVRLGVEVQRKNANLPEHIVRIMATDEEELVNRAYELIEQIAQTRERALLDAANTIDAEEVVGTEWKPALPESIESLDTEVDEDGDGSE